MSNPEPENPYYVVGKALYEAMSDDDADRFDDLPPTLKFTRGYWAALSERERKDALETAAWAHVRIEFVDDGEWKAP